MSALTAWTCRCHRWHWIATANGASAYAHTPVGLTRVADIQDRILAEIDHPEYRPGPVVRALNRLDVALDRKIHRLTHPGSS